MKNSIDTIGYRTRSASTNYATVGGQAETLAYSRRPRYVDITHESQFRKGNIDECKIICDWPLCKLLILHTQTRSNLTFDD
jgi:hypothetical protein